MEPNIRPGNILHLTSHMISGYFPFGRQNTELPGYVQHWAVFTAPERIWTRLRETQYPQSPGDICGALQFSCVVPQLLASKS